MTSIVITPLAASCHGVGTSFSSMQSVATNRHGTFRRVMLETNADYTANRQALFWTRPDGGTVIVDDRVIGGGGGFVEALDTGEVIIGWAHSGGLRVLTFPDVSVGLTHLTPRDYQWFTSAKFVAIYLPAARRITVLGYSGHMIELDVDNNCNPLGVSQWAQPNAANGESLQYICPSVVNERLHLFWCNANSVNDVFNYAGMAHAFTVNPCEAVPAWFAGNINLPLATPFDISSEGPAVQMTWGKQARDNNTFLMSGAMHKGRAYAAYSASPSRGERLGRYDDLRSCATSLVSVDPLVGQMALRAASAIEQSPLRGSGGNIIRALSGAFCRTPDDLYFVCTNDRALVVFLLQPDEKFREVSRTTLPVSGNPETAHYVTMQRESFDGVLRGSLTMIQLTPSQIAASSIAGLANAKAFAIGVTL